MTMAIRPAGGRFPAKWLPAFGFPLPCPRCEGSGRGRLLVEIEHCPPAGQPSPGLPGKDPKIPAARTEAGSLPLVDRLESKARHGHGELNSLIPQFRIPVVSQSYRKVTERRNFGAVKSQPTKDFRRAGPKVPSSRKPCKTSLFNTLGTPPAFRIPHSESHGPKRQDRSVQGNTRPGFSQRTTSAGSWFGQWSGDPARTTATNPIGKKTRVNRNFAACQSRSRSLDS